LLAALHRADRDANEERALRELADEQQEVRFDYSPFDEVIDFLQAHDNWFPQLEEAADRLRTDSRWGRRILSDQIAAALAERLGVRVAIEPVGRAGRGESSIIRRYDAEAGVLTLSAGLLEQRSKFQLAHTVGLRLLDQGDTLAELLARYVPRHSET